MYLGFGSQGAYVDSCSSCGREEVIHGEGGEESVTEKLGNCLELPSKDLGAYVVIDVPICF